MLHGPLPCEVSRRHGSATVPASRSIGWAKGGWPGRSWVVMVVVGVSPRAMFVRGAALQSLLLKLSLGQRQRIDPVLQKDFLPNTRYESHLAVGLDFCKPIYG